MKTKRTVLRFLLASIVLLLVFSGCQNHFEQPNPELSSEGKGFFTLNLGEVTLGRTILPATPANVSDFKGFKLEFLNNSTVRKTVSCPPANYSDPITLDAGTYELLVTAYLDTGLTQPAAQGSKTGIEIKNGQTTSAGVELAAIIQNAVQTGTFKWTISYPSSTSTASMEITPIAGTGGTKQTRTLTNGTADSLTLNAGYYRVVFTLYDNAVNKGAERWEILHIYQNMESAFACTFAAGQFQFYNSIKVTNGNNTGEGSLRQAITDVVLSGDTIVIDSGVGTIQLTEQLQIAAAKNFVLEGNGVKIQATTWTPANTPAILFDSGAVVTIRRVCFSDTQVMVISNFGNLSLESCIFSNNAAGTGTGSYSIRNAGTIGIKGSTFYKNSGDTGGVINMQGGSATLTGNLFYGNTNTGNTRPIAAPNNGTITSGGYNMVDVPLGIYSGYSGWTGHSTDKVIGNQPIVEANFKPLPGKGAQNVITSRPGGYPTVDFYGKTIPSSNAAAGAVQDTASGYLIEVSVNNSALGKADITSAPALNADGLYNGGSVTFTATVTGPAGYGFQYWLVNNNTTNTTNPLTLTLTDHYKVQAVFGRNSTNSARMVLFSGPTETVTLNGLGNNDIYLVRVNTSENIVNAVNTGGPSGLSPSPSPNIQSDMPRNELPRMGHPAADEFNANPPTFVDAGPRRSRAVFASPVVGNTRMFWVETYYNSRIFVQRQATLRAAGQYGNIWVMDENYGSGGGNKIDTVKAQTLAAKFDEIYPIETNLLGYEYGGGPGGDGGKDGDPKIQILVYNIVNASGTNQAAGYFWSKDFYDQAALDSSSGWKTNLAEIFYVDAGQTNISLNYIYSTLVHEFQHMINFNMKFVKHGKSSASWYDEMLAMMTQDVIEPLIGVTLTDSVQTRMPLFLTTYNQVGITEWNNLENESYAKGYAFGAYLLRNYGGASLLQEMLANNSTNIDSITAALIKIAGGGLSFEEALRRFGEAMVFSGTTMPADVQSFDKTVTKTIGSHTYTVTKFNIWGDFGSTKPKIFGVNEQVEMRPYSITVHQAASGWTGQSGNKSITLQRPNDPNVELYLMVK